MKQSAVEWLEERFEKFLAYYEGHHKAEMYSIHQLSNNFDQAKEMEKKQQGYSEEDLIEFSEWISHNDWVYLQSKGYWVNEEAEELEEKFTTKELFNKFKNK